MSPPLSPVSIEILRSVEQMDALGPEWVALEERTPEANGFQSFTWCRTWVAAMEAAGVASRLHIVTVRSEGRLVMLWPLHIKSRLGVLAARWIGAPMTQYGDILAEPSPERTAWAETAKAASLTREGIDLFSFTCVRADSAFIASKVMPATKTQHVLAPFVGNLSSPDGSPTMGRNKGLRRRIKALRTLGSIDCAEALDASARIAAVRLALLQKRQWLNDKGLVSAGFADLVSEPFLEQMAYLGALRVHRLLVAGEPAAIEIGFTHRGIYRSLVGSYDRRFAAGAPGHVLTAMLIKRCRDEGLLQYDFLAPADPYKIHWSNGTVDVGSQFQAVSMRGLAGAVTYRHLRPLAKQVQAGLPKSAKQVLARVVSGTRIASLNPSAPSPLGHADG